MSASESGEWSTDNPFSAHHWKTKRFPSLPLEPEGNILIQMNGLPIHSLSSFSSMKSFLIKFAAAARRSKSEVDFDIGVKD